MRNCKVLLVTNRDSNSFPFLFVPHTKEVYHVSHHKTTSSSVMESMLEICVGIYFFREPIQFSSVTQSCPTLCDPMNHSTPGLPVHHQLRSSLRLSSIESVMPFSHLILCRPLLLLPPIPPYYWYLIRNFKLSISWNASLGQLVIIVKELFGTDI